MNKKIVVIISSILIIFACLAVLFITKPFANNSQEIDENDDYSNQVENLQDSTKKEEDAKKVLKDIEATESMIGLEAAGVKDIYQDGNIRPNKVVTRGEFFKMMSIVQADNEAVESFSGEIVNPYDPYIEYIYNQEKAIADIEISKENIESPITKREATIIIGTFAHKNKFLSNFDYDTHKECDIFTDINDFSEDEKYLLNYALKCELIAGYDSSTFLPNKPMTRDEVATMLLKFCNVWVEAYNGSLKSE